MGWEGELGSLRGSERHDVEPCSPRRSSDHGWDTCLRGNPRSGEGLIDYLEGGHSLAEFLEDFPTVKREQAIAVLEQAKQMLVSSAPAAR